MGAKGELASSWELGSVRMVSEMVGDDGKGIDVSITESKDCTTDNSGGMSMRSSMEYTMQVLAGALKGRTGKGCLIYLAALIRRTYSFVQSKL